MEINIAASQTLTKNALSVEGSFKANQKASQLDLRVNQSVCQSPCFEGSSRPITVLMTTDTVGGVWVYAVTLAAALRKYNIKVILAAMGGSLSESQREQIVGLDNVYCFESDYKLEWMKDPWADVISAGQWLASLADKYQPDVAHLNNYTHAAIKCWPCPVLVAGHSCVYSWYQQVKGQMPSEGWKRYFCRVTTGLKCADLVTAPTWTFLHTLSEIYGKFRSAGAVYNGIEPFSTTNRKEMIIFSAGRIWDEGKNIQILKKVQPLIEWPIFVAGSRHHPDGSFADCGCLRHLDHLDAQQIRHWYAKSAIYVLGSLYEPFGLSALEAANAGCALVLADIPSLREIWADAAIFVNPRDEKHIAQALSMLMRDSVLRAEYAQKAKARALLYSADKMAERYRCLYSRLIKNEPAYLSAAVSL